MTNDDKDKDKDKKLPTAPTGTGVKSRVDYGEDYGKGFGEVDASDQLLPVFQLLQSNSKACTPGTEQFVQGAQGGMFLDTIGRELFDGSPGLVFVPCYVTHSWVEWVPHDAGGGYRGRRPYCPPEQLADAKPDPKGRLGRYLLEKAGTELVDTRYLWGLTLETPDAQTPSAVAVFPITSSKVKPFRHWLNIAGRVTDGQGKSAPPFSHRVRVSAKLRPNPKGNPFFVQLMLPVTQHAGELSSLDEAIRSQLLTTLDVDGKQVPHPVYAGARKLWHDVNSGAMASMLDASLQRAAAEEGDDPQEGIPAGAPGSPTAPF